MPPLLTLEWNDREARFVLAASRGNNVTIEQAFSVSLEPRDSDDESTKDDVGKRLAAALAARGIGRTPMLVAVGRSHIELRQFSLPPAPDNELPEMVRFQAMREFNELNESWLLDYMPLDDAPDGQRSVLAAAISPDTVARIKKVCAAANLVPERLVLRPCAAASHFAQRRTASSAPTLLIDLLTDEADLTVIVDKEVVFLRTARLVTNPLETPDGAKALSAEIRRTMMAAQNQLGGQRIAAIALCGGDTQHAALAKAIEEATTTPTELFDPFAGVDLGSELRDTLPEYPSRFASLLGMACDELQETTPAIDFLHPRRAAEPPSRRKLYIAAAVAVLLAVGMFFGYVRLQRNSLQTELAGLEAEIESLDKFIDAADKQRAIVEQIDVWTDSNVVWLDELYRLSGDFLPAKDAMLSRLNFSKTAGGTTKLQGFVAASATIEDLEERLRNGNPSRDVQNTGSREDETGGQFYSWSFNASLSVKTEEE